MAKWLENMTCVRWVIGLNPKKAKGGGGAARAFDLNLPLSSNKVSLVWEPNFLAPYRE